MKMLFAALVVLLSSHSAFAVLFPLWLRKSESPNWNQTLKNSLLNENKDLLDSSPADARSFCANFRNLGQTERVKFWVQLVAALAEKESDFQPNTRYTEKFRDSSGSKVVSRGLLQLSIESAKAYGCNVSSASDLQRASTNLNCGLKIMKKWILHDGRIQGGSKDNWRGLARYWGPFRNAKILESMRNEIRSISVCKL